MLYISFILEARGRSRAESPKRTHREVIVTFYRHPAIAVAKLNNKYNMLYVFLKSSPGNKYE